ncbi:hypothetical protein BJ982_006129 [Sphaerisporangium siamense]|uniref:XRE family transcriptional regulator n=1 Tax=Sphaerisporangium siamense TaxID=795645 RepID=A0A7W7DEK5_9ACTN|nr:hypothetical protein [Sphaerisporangium siamense]
MASLLPVDLSLLAKWEKGTRRPSADAVRRLDGGMEADGFLVALHAFVVATPRSPLPTATERQWDAEGMDQLRRRLLSGIVAGAASALPPMDGLERLRSMLDDSVGHSGVADWEETVWEYSNLVPFDIPGVVRDLSVDLLALQQAMAGARAAEIPRWLRVNARMSMMLAYALGSAGQGRESHHWWRSAQRVAAQTDDAGLMASVCCHEAVQALHQRRPLPLVISRASKALALTDGKPCRATSAALGARAHAYALGGDIAQARADLDEQARVFDQLPSEVTSDRRSIEGWPDTRVLYSRSLVHTITEHPDVDSVQQEAADAYPPGWSRQREQVELHRAYTEVKRRHVDSGLGHAARVFTNMPQEAINTFVRHNALAVGDVVPAAERNRPSVVEYRELVTQPSREVT